MNSTIETMLNHRSIRKFTDRQLSTEELNTIYEVARRTSFSIYLQQFTIIHVSDRKIRKAISQICNQEFINQPGGDLFIFLADLHRNYQLRKEAGLTADRLENMDLFTQALADATLAISNSLTAAESMGLGGVFLGSIKNDSEQVGKLLKLPKFVIPALGLLIGEPADRSQLKPRIPKKVMIFENTYPEKEISRADLTEFDQEVNEYYLKRDKNARDDNFTNQIVGLASVLNPQKIKRNEMLAYYHKQGLIKR